jgi:hypothetical protein
MVSHRECEKPDYVDRILRLIRTEPGLLQHPRLYAAYKGMGGVVDDAPRPSNAIRIVAELAGDGMIQRVREGRTYRLFPTSPP